MSGGRWLTDTASLVRVSLRFFVLVYWAESWIPSSKGRQCFGPRYWSLYPFQTSGGRVQSSAYSSRSGGCSSFRRQVDRVDTTSNLNSAESSLCWSLGCSRRVFVWVVLAVFARLHYNIRTWGYYVIENTTRRGQWHDNLTVKYNYYGIVRRLFLR